MYPAIEEDPPHPDCALPEALNTSHQTGPPCRFGLEAGDVGPHPLFFPADWHLPFHEENYKGFPKMPIAICPQHDKKLHLTTCKITYMRFSRFGKT